MRLILQTLRPVLLAGALCLSEAGTARAEPVFAPPVDHVEYGIVCDYVPRGRDVPAPGTNAGKVRRGGVPVRFDHQTDLVPARHGLAFGIRIHTAPSSGTLEVTMVTRHPPFGPGYLDTESWTSSITGGVPSARYFFFEFDYELAPGPWTMEVYLDGDPLISKTFTVFDPALRPDMPDPCPGADVYS
ncbi:hypothetical protein OB2597_10174 [Pseudooceanicola batsensis HTCC2597]|uniref:DUF3859 domain-containing protein n=1 Tax=Pseudooceanicola batsensis (strain ATCC BAA-863 / DSM 15984 / KCTC 12145 / HTCC2597) TaxID=252305 RepID=A3TVF7_PSEBH|nr:DUF3859 domain-containing protein [Pseudooceanicola batsensis]EAQ04503.1 hypothetical protein OB2597_10174 [Pseudooceanicola batsensis HTCC2597]